MEHGVQAPQLPETRSNGAAINDPSSPEVGAFTVLKACPSSASDRESTLMDHRPLPRSRRRRTSPEDQAVLEAEFQRNPKPDRATRTDIVGRVSLGEKEVQIWFQNRRQIARRKASAPLTQDNSSTIFRNISTAVLGSIDQCIDNQARRSVKTVQHRDLASQSTSVTEPSEKDEKDLNSVEKESTHNVIPATKIFVDHSSASGPNGLHITRGVKQDNGTALSGSTQNPPSTIKETAATQEMSVISIGDSSSTARPQTFTGLPPLLLKRKSSSLRLSTSFNGKAQIIVDNSSSPPRPSSALQKLTRIQRPLQRSQSEFSSQPSSTSIFSDFMPMPRRLAPSRSRDARTWEFYCDSDARDALTAQAENEQKGKAETTIGLIRSSSSSKKTDSPATSVGGPAKRKSSNRKSHSRPKLARTESSVARLQTISSNANLKVENPVVTTKKGEPGTMLVVDLSGDFSDKENWVPGTRRRQVRSPRPEAETRSRSTLGENSEIPSHSNSLESHLERDVGRRGRLNGTPTSEGKEEPQDPEVAAFMGEATGPRVAEDLDCVQQLLSLSQGAWS